MTGGAGFPHERELAARLRLMVLTVPDPACGRSLQDVVGECLEAGATAIQVRDKGATAAQLFDTTVRLLPLVRQREALLIVNDRFDVALAAGADGVHLGPLDLPVREVRDSVPSGFLIGYSTDDPTTGRGAAEDGADYLGVGAIYGTRSKPGLESESIGPERLSEVLSVAGIPGVGIGGIGPHNAAAVARTGAGIAVLGAVMNASEPAGVVSDLARIVERFA